MSYFQKKLKSGYTDSGHTHCLMIEGRAGLAYNAVICKGGNMKIILSSYHVNRGLADGEEAVTEVEFSPDTEQHMVGKENYVDIKMGNKIARVKSNELKKVVDVSV
jgi:hypothetical protein